MNNICSTLSLRRPAPLFAALLFIGFTLTGCVGYRLGSMLPPDIQTVYVPTFVNETQEPLLELETTRRAINFIQRDGSLRIESENAADAILHVTLHDFRLQALTFDQDRRAAAEEYRLLITAAIAMVRADTGEVIVQDPSITGDTTFLFTGDLTSSKQAALPDAADDLAQLIISRIVETW